MKDPQADTPGSDRRWWLTDGPEQCSLCEASAHPETLTYCVVCDRGLCTLCYHVSAMNAPSMCPECDKAIQDGSAEAAD